MTDDIASMTLELARDPGSLVFLRLADTLRRRGQLDAALTVATRGAVRYPEVADAHDLLARIHADLGDGDAAFDAWTTVLRLAPDHVGAHKGLAFLAYRGNDLGRSVKYLSRASELAPTDATLAAAVEKIRIEMSSRAAQADRAQAPAGSAAVEPPKPETGNALLFDPQGRVLRGQLARPDGSDASDAVAAALAGVSKEAERTARLLGMGEWRAIAIEGGSINYELRSPTRETLLLVMRGREVPAGRLARIADRAVDQARSWLEALE